jgi:HPt (histidine-containing phosphotransfer) domain-containing protein
MSATYRNPMDYSSALKRTGGDEEFLSMLIEVYISDFKIRFQAMKQAVMDRNFNQLYHQGHTLKGSSANLSLSTLQKISYQMEAAGKEKDLKLAQETLKKLNMEFKLFQNYCMKEKKLNLTGAA